jgi:hypothetical protein
MAGLFANDATDDQIRNTLGSSAIATTSFLRDTNYLPCFP